MAMNASSREPQSRSIACLTVVEVVSGPGVNSQGSSVVISVLWSCCWGRCSSRAAWSSDGYGCRYQMHRIGSIKTRAPSAKKP